MPIAHTPSSARRFKPGELTSPDGQVIQFSGNGALHPGEPPIFDYPDEWVEWSRRWVQDRCAPTRGMLHRVYGDLKPYCTEWVREASAGAVPYLCQGAIIAALLLEGYCCTQVRWGSPNVWTNASNRRLLPGRLLPVQVRRR